MPETYFKVLVSTVVERDGDVSGTVVECFSGGFIVDYCIRLHQLVKSVRLELCQERSKCVYMVLGGTMCEWICRIISNSNVSP